MKDHFARLDSRNGELSKIENSQGRTRVGKGGGGERWRLPTHTKYSEQNKKKLKCVCFK